MKKVTLEFDIPDDAIPTLATLDYVIPKDYGFKEIYVFELTEEGYKGVKVD